MHCKLEEIPTCVFDLLGRVEQHLQATNDLAEAQEQGGDKHVAKVQAKLVDSLNNLAVSSVEAKKHMVMLASLEAQSASRPASRVTLS